MNKAALAAHLAEKIGISKTQAESAIEWVADTIIKTLKEGGSVTIAGFGEFYAKTRKGRMGVNPQNPKEKMQIPSVVVAKFKAGKNLKDALKGKAPA